MSPWHPVSLEEHLEFLTSGSRGWSRYVRERGAMFLRIQNVGLNQLMLEDVVFVDAPPGAEAERTRVRPGDVLLSITADLGRTAVVPAGLGPAHINQHLAILRVRELEPRFVAAFISLGPGRAQLEKLDRGGVKSGLNFDDIRSLQIPRPPLAEQRRIADVLDKADAIRRKRREAIALTEELLRSAFLEMFGDPVTNPKGWPVTTLGDQAEQMKYGTSEKCDATDGAGLPVLRIPNVVGGEIDWGDLKYARLEQKEATSLRLQKGDLLFVRSNGNPAYIGRCAVYDAEREALFASYLIRVRVDERRVEPGYVRAALSSPSYRALLTSEARTTAGNYNISTEGLRRLRLPLPPVARQREFVAFVHEARAAGVNLSRGVTEAEDLFSSLVARAFSGGLSS